MYASYTVRITSPSACSINGNWKEDVNLKKQLDASSLCKYTHPAGRTFISDYFGFDSFNSDWIYHGGL